MTVNAYGVTYNGTGAPASGPAGAPETKPVTVYSYGGISGVSGVSQMSLLGVFLGPNEPADPAPTEYDFSGSGASASLRQTFYIGSGTHQLGASLDQFKIPSKATRAYFGFADAYGNGPGPPGYYDDNTGSLDAVVDIQKPKPPEPPPEPEPVDPLAVAKIAEFRTANGMGKPHAFFFRGGEKQEIGPKTQLRPGDDVETDENTIVAIEFAIGGRVAVKPDTLIRILSERSAGGLTKPGAKAGGIWAKCDKLKEPFEVQTSGGVMGIKG